MGIGETLCRGKFINYEYDKKLFEPDPVYAYDIRHAFCDDRIFSGGLSDYRLSETVNVTRVAYDDLPVYALAELSRTTRY